ncbi:MAG: hypothetical protein ACFFCI_14470 [Promethearchaeota archaeon]
MNEKLLCKIVFVEAGWSTPLKIIGVVDKTQLYSPVNAFIEVKNYRNKVISKGDIEEIVVYKEHKRIVLAKPTFEVSTSLKIEG